MIYLGIGTLILRYIQRKVVVIAAGRFILHFLLVLIGIFTPVLLLTIFGDNRGSFLNEPIHIFNLAWGIDNAINSGRTRIHDGFVACVCGRCYRFNLQSARDHCRASADKSAIRCGLSKSKNHLSSDRSSTSKPVG